ncbi:MAG: hypothetical protein KC493_14445 [Bacteriovoracaceae bacterium]|nr:hypothetical protein [Bacteriovoracaceae bacterium]
MKFFILLILIPFSALAEINVELQILNRCYSQLVHKRISSNHELVLKVKKGKLNGSEACTKFLESIKLNDHGLLSPKSEETIQVLRTFQRLHDSWFPRFNFNVNTQDYPNTDLYDANEMGYHFTWVLFKDELLKNVLTKKRSFRGVREASKEHRYFIDRTIKGDRQKRKKHIVNKWKIGGEEDKESDEFQGPISFWEPELVEFGTLIGLKPYSSSKNRIKKWLGKDQQRQFDTHAPKGGGIIGSVPYLLLNAGQNEERMDGGNKLHRRWATSISSDLLCRTLPILKKEEVKSFVRRNSKIGFRKKSDCMNCHSTIDTMAAVLRNMENYNSGNVDVHYTVRNIYMNESVRVHKGELPDSSKLFYQTKPEGKFIHKDLFGQKIDKKIQSLQELGKELSKTPDFYFCVAKRYLHFFTGVNINLESVSWNKPKSEEAKFLKLLATKLMKNQEMDELINSIYHSKIFREIQ